MFCFVECKIHVLRYVPTDFDIIYPSCLQLANAHAMLGIAYCYIKEPKLAAESFKTSLSIFKQLFGEDSAFCATALTGLCVSNFLIGSIPESKSYGKRAISTFDVHPDVSHYRGENLEHSYTLYPFIIVPIPNRTTILDTHYFPKHGYRCLVHVSESYKSWFVFMFFAMNSKVKPLLWSEFCNKSVAICLNYATVN